MVTITPTLSYTQDMALALRFIPDDSSAVVKTREDYLISMIKDIIPNYNYNLRDIKKMEQIIKQHKEKLNYKGDWGDSVSEITYVVRKKNLSMAYELIHEIINMDQGIPATTAHDLPYILSLKLVYYIDILKFLINEIGKNELTNIYVLVENQYEITLNRLIALPEVNHAPERGLNWSFGSCMQSAAAVVHPKIRNSRVHAESS